MDASAGKFAKIIRVIGMLNILSGVAGCLLLGLFIFAHSQGLTKEALAQFTSEQIGFIHIVVYSLIPVSIYTVILGKALRNFRPWSYWGAILLYVASIAHSLWRADSDGYLSAGLSVLFLYFIVAGRENFSKQVA